MSAPDSFEAGRPWEVNVHGRPNGFVQWKGTKVCMDVYCVCGSQFHIDAAFAYAVQCLACGRRYEVSCHVAMREMTKGDRLWDRALTDGNQLEDDAADAELGT